MGRPITVVLGPLAAASANKISLSQKSASARNLVLDGAAGTATANNICLSQTPGGAGALTLDGALASGSPVVANISTMQPVYITAAADESGKTFVISGYGYGPGGGPFAITETVTGPNASTVSTNASFWTITSITVSAGTTGAVTVGTYGAATLDVARQVIITSAGNDSAISFAITGTDWAGSTISETLTGANAGVATSVLSYKTITSVVPSGAVASTLTIGTNTVASSPMIYFDPLATQGPVSIQCNASGTVNYTVQQSLDNPTATGSPYTRATMNWLNHPDSNLVAATGTVQGNYAYQPAFARVVLNSGSGTVTATFIQAYLG